MKLPWNSRGGVRFASYNMLNLFDADTEKSREHYAMVVDVIRGLRADVLAVQEIRAPQAEQARELLRQLAGDTKMNCVVPGKDDSSGTTALAAGARGYHCGLLWRSGLDPVPGSFRESPPGRFWHGAGWLKFDFEGVKVRHATFHATPFGRQMRAEQNELLVAMLVGGADKTALLIGADWNGESADRVPDEKTGDLRLYEPGDPFAGVPWFDDMLYQCEWEYDDHGQRRHWSDRRPGDVLFAGGLLDAAAVLRAPWQPTTGYWPGDRYTGIDRRIDQIRVSRRVAPALRSYHVTDTPQARRASDHLPVYVEYAPGDIAS